MSDFEPNRISKDSWYNMFKPRVNQTDNPLLKQDRKPAPENTTASRGEVIEHVKEESKERPNEKNVSKKKYTRHAEWASSKEVKDAFDSFELGSLSEPGLGGIPMFYEKSKAYINGSDNHTLIIGSTGSMKSRRVLGPTIRHLCRFGESMIVSDPKGELLRWNHVRLKEEGYNIKVLDFRNPQRSDRWNPLSIPAELVRSGNPNLENTGYKMIKDLCYNLIPDQEKDPYWNLAARGLLYGLIVLLIRECKDPRAITFNNVIALKNRIFKSDQSRDKFIASMSDDDPVFTSMSATLINADGTRRCILSVLDAFIVEFITTPSVSNMLCENEIDVFKTGFEKSAIFIIVPDEQESMNFLISTFVAEAYQALIMKAQEYDGAKLPIRVNFILDEFGNNPKISEMSSMITASRSRNIRLMLAIQSYDQLTSKYGKDAKVIESNCLCLLYLCSRDYDFVTYLSNLVGKDERGDHLITPAALMRLSKEKGEALVINDRMNPFITNLKDIGELMSEEENCPYEFGAKLPPVLVPLEDDKKMAKKMKISVKKVDSSDDDDW